ncbi:MAG: hypothetical protein HY673_19940 [Chloroflexi bacterium]|nr:hypothetical protein [Chloroflexota bacterium]
MARKYILMTCLLSLALLACGNPEQTTIVPAATATIGEEPFMRKVSPLLLNQIEMRQQQQKQPTPQRRDQMQAMGMDLADLNVQKVFVHLAQRPNDTQVQELRALGVTLYADSWIPPAGSAPTGFLLADMPVSALKNLASKEYVVKLETAERLSQPQGSPRGDKVNQQESRIQ